MPSISSTPPVLPPRGAGKNRSTAAVPAPATQPDTANPPANRGGRPRGAARGPVFSWSQERLAALVHVVAVDGVKTAAEIQVKLASHPLFTADAHLLKRESILRWVGTLQEQYVEAGRPDLAAKLELRKSGSAWRPDLDALAAVMEGGAEAAAE